MSNDWRVELLDMWTPLKFWRLSSPCRNWTSDAPGMQVVAPGRNPLQDPSLGKGRDESRPKSPEGLGHLSRPTQKHNRFLYLLGDHDIYEFIARHDPKLWGPGVLATGGHWKWGLLRRKCGWEVSKVNMLQVYLVYLCPEAIFTVGLGGSKWDTACFGWSFLAPSRNCGTRVKDTWRLTSAVVGQATMDRFKFFCRGAYPKGRLAGDFMLFPTTFPAERIKYRLNCNEHQQYGSSKSRD